MHDLLTYEKIKKNTINISLISNLKKKQF